MWKRLSLRTRLLLPLGLMFAAALLVGGVALQIFTPLLVAREDAPPVRSTRTVANALNSALRVSSDPQATLQAVAQSLGMTRAIQFRPARTPIDEPATRGRASNWFDELIGTPAIGASFPVMIADQRVGDIVFEPGLMPEYSERRVGFVLISGATLALLALSGAIAFIGAGTTLGPLRSLGAGLTRMRQGNYGQLIPAAGPPEIRQSCEEANELARTLNQLSQDNRSLLRKMVSLQDDERREIARELHDELGPLLFGIRANTIALLEAMPPGQDSLVGFAEGTLQSVEALQQANRRVLDRLRPLHIQELGLEKSIHAMLQNARSQAPRLKLTAHIDPQLNAVDGLLSRTVYRVIQEGVTNALRHAGAQTIKVNAVLADGQLKVDICDDGVGFPPDQVFGRGLTGMQERARALSGTLELLREDGRTCVRCRLPLGEAPLDAGTANGA